jgi:hypothetical protein
MPFRFTFVFFRIQIYIMRIILAFALIVAALGTSKPHTEKSKEEVVLEKLTKTRVARERRSEDRGVGSNSHKQKRQNLRSFIMDELEEYYYE